MDIRIPAPRLRRLATALLHSYGCDEHEAAIVSEHLVEANLYGHDSHGIGMLPMYGEQVRDGNLIPGQTPELSPPLGAITRVDGRRGFGHHMALLALDHAMSTVPEHKVAILGLRNSGHISRTGKYAEYCAAQGYVSMHFVNVIGHSPLVAPYGSRETAFSTNPIAMAMPVQRRARPLLDMATSTVAFGKVRVAHNQNKSVPPGCLLDKEGLDTTDPGPMAERREGALSAFGAHKGSGLGIFAELLAGALVSEHTVATAPHLPHGALNSMLSIIIDPAAFDDPARVAERTTIFCDSISHCQPARGVERVLLPGEPEQMSAALREAEGIPVDEQTLQQIFAIGAAFGCDRTQLSALIEHDA